MGKETATLSHILVVDDDVQFTDLINMILVRQRYGLTVARDFATLNRLFSEEGREERQRPYDLVLLAGMMAGLDGRGFTMAAHTARNGRCSHHHHVYSG